MKSEARPTLISRFSPRTDVSVAEAGAALLGMPLFPQGLQVARVMEARRRGGKRYVYPEVAVEEPRRASKTTAIWSVLLGRCLRIPGYRVVATAQDGSHASDKLIEYMEVLEARGFEEQDLGSLYWSNGKEKIKFANGSVLWRVTPKPGAFRSAGADAILFDEAGELDPEIGPAMLAGALPLMDTRPNGQVIVAGTPGKRRAGLLWESLERARAKTPGVGVVDYSLRDDEVLVSYDDDGERVLDERVLRRVHPGIGTLTTMALMRERFARMQVPEFEAEYGCRWPSSSTTGAFDVDQWAGVKVAPGERPDRVGIAFDCAYDGSSASIVYAWRVGETAFVEVVAHRSGTSWVARAAHEAGLKYRRVPVAYDSIGANLDPATGMTRLKPAPRLEALPMKAIMGAAQRFTSELHEGRLRHFGQVDLTAGVENTAWRDITHSGRAFGSKDPSGAAINPVVAASLALWSYDKGKDRQPLGIAA